MDEAFVILKLKDPIYDQMGEVIREPNRLDATADEIEGKTQSEVRRMSPKLDYGTLILRALATATKPKDAEEAAKTYTYIKAIRNKYQTDKAEWKLEEKDLKELKEYLKKCEGMLRSPMMVGQLYERIESLEMDLKAQTKKEDSKEEKE